MSAVVCVPLNVMFRLVMFICSPVAVKLNDIIVTLVEPIAVVAATLLVPVTASVPKIVDGSERIQLVDLGKYFGVQAGIWVGFTIIVFCLVLFLGRKAE